MERVEAIRIVRALADGRDPFTDQPLPSDNVCQHPQVVRALCAVVQELRILDRRESAAKSTLENAGKSWTAQEDDDDHDDGIRDRSRR
jgi:hypothetical protein